MPGILTYTMTRQTQFWIILRATGETDGFCSLMEVFPVFAVVGFAVVLLYLLGVVHVVARKVNLILSLLQMKLFKQIIGERDTSNRRLSHVEANDRGPLKNHRNVDLFEQN